MQVPHRMIERAVQRFELDSHRKGSAYRAPQAGPQTAPSPPPSGRVITISRQLGSGGRKIAELLGGWLGWQVWDREILDALANESSRHLQARLFEAIDEVGRGEVDVVMSSLFGRVSDFSYYFLLPRAVLAIARQDAIIVGRGAHLYLPHALKVRVVAPDSVRESNLVRFEGLDVDEARQRMRASDREREAFRKAITQHLQRTRPAPAGETEYDLVLNTGALGIETAARLVRQAAELRFGLLTKATGVRKGA